MRQANDGQTDQTENLDIEPQKSSRWKAHFGISNQRGNMDYSIDVIGTILLLIFSKEVTYWCSKEVTHIMIHILHMPPLISKNWIKCFGEK